MTQVQSIFSQAAGILNSQDANGDYIYGGGNSTTPPLSVSSLSQLMALPSAANAFTNGSDLKSVQVADGQTVTYGLGASTIGQGLMQALQDIANFDAGGSGNFTGSSSLSQAQNTFLTGHISSLATVNTGLNNITAANGGIYNQLKSAASHQKDMSTLYSGFISNIQDTNLADAATQLQLNQTALQAALQVTSTLNQLTLLNYLPTR
jgi:flagellar hook-associated protein 3 FlgL